MVSACCLATIPRPPIQLLGGWEEGDAASAAQRARALGPPAAGAQSHHETKKTRPHTHPTPTLTLFTQSDEEHHDVHFESADAGASLTYPQQAGTVRKNGFLVIKGRPCKVADVSTSKTGERGG